MEERKWLLGEDLATYDNLLDPVTFDDLILALHCNVRKQDINSDATRRELGKILKQRLEDMQALLEKNTDKIIEYSRNYYRDE